MPDGHTAGQPLSPSTRPLRAVPGWRSFIAPSPELTPFLAGMPSAASSPHTPSCTLRVVLPLATVALTTGEMPATQPPHAPTTLMHWCAEERVPPVCRFEGVASG